LKNEDRALIETISNFQNYHHSKSSVGWLAPIVSSELQLKLLW